MIVVNIIIDLLIVLDLVLYIGSEYNKFLLFLLVINIIGLVLVLGKLCTNNVILMTYKLICEGEKESKYTPKKLVINGLDNREYYNIDKNGLLILLRHNKKDLKSVLYEVIDSRNELDNTMTSLNEYLKEVINTKSILTKEEIKLIGHIKTKIYFIKNIQPALSIELRFTNNEVRPLYFNYRYKYISKLIDDIQSA
jgi:hypothetical protein